MRAVVFDMDGILFDTERICQYSWIQVAKRRGLPGMEDVFSRCIGLNSAGSRQIVTEAYGEDFDYEDFRTETSIWFWDYIEANGLPVMPGAEKLLCWLKGSGWILGLASSTRSTTVLKHLEQAGFSEYFSTVVTGDMVKHSKPQPDIYLQTCSKLNVNPEEAYAIEDSPNGIRSAHAAGMCPLMVPDMIAPDEEMRNLSYRIFEDLTQVLEFLKGEGK